MIKLTHTQS